MSRIKVLFSRHPRLAAWSVLAISMVAILLVASRDAGLLVSQLVFIIVATVMLAGLCVWILSWD